MTNPRRENDVDALTLTARGPKVADHVPQKARGSNLTVVTGRRDGLYQIERTMP